MNCPKTAERTSIKKCKACEHQCLDYLYEDMNRKLVRNERYHDNH
nr:hypothetical protein [Candidatus Sigynarchaeota archaeon]